MADGGLPLHSVVAVGNAGRLGVPQVAGTLAASERVSAVGMVVESFADLRAGRVWPGGHGSVRSVSSRWC